MLNSSLCSYRDAYIAVKGTISVPNTGTVADPNNRNKEVVFKNCALFTDCISEISNMQIDNAKDIDVVINIYNLIEYDENYSHTSGGLWQYYRDQRTLNDDGNIIDFPVNDVTSFDVPTVKIKDYNVMKDGKNFLDQSEKRSINI